MTSPAAASLAYFLGRLQVLETRLTAAIDQCLELDSAPHDPSFGRHDFDEQGVLLPSGPPLEDGYDGIAEGLLEDIERTADAAEAEGRQIRLRELARNFCLDPFELDVLLLALAPDVDFRYGDAYAYLNDDSSKTRLTFRLAIELAGMSCLDPSTRLSLSRAGRLASSGLVAIRDEGRPFLTRVLCVPDRVTSYLLGDDSVDPSIASVATPSVSDDPTERSEGDDDALDECRRAAQVLLSQDCSLLYCRESKDDGSALAHAQEILTVAGLPGLVVDLSTVQNDDDLETSAALLAREARLQSAVLIVASAEEFVDRRLPAVRAMLDLPTATIVTGAMQWDSSWSRRVPLIVSAPRLTDDKRQLIWAREFNGHQLQADPLEATKAFELRPLQIREAARAAVLMARHREGSNGDVAIAKADLVSGARLQSGSHLGRLVTRVSPDSTWASLVLPNEAMNRLQEVVTRVQHRNRVFGEWGLRSGSKGTGITVLFAGAPGTGKTLSAEVIAYELGLDLYVINLAMVVDKYIGETEKKLDRVFADMERVDGVLLFDEADALFGKRSHVSDARDRYANIEVAYLLQRMERFTGVAILATNMRANLDEAFTRRLDVVVDFRRPDADMRSRLWSQHLASVETADDLNLPELARAFDLTGGEIAKASVSAAFLAAAAGRPVSEGLVRQAILRELQKLGRLVYPSEFDQTVPVIAGDSR